jgi:hypothetical protein
LKVNGWKRLICSGKARKDSSFKERTIAQETGVIGWKVVPNFLEC